MLQQTLRAAMVVGVAALSWAEVETQEDERRRRTARRLSPVVGHWENTTENGEPVLLLDSTKWKSETAPPGAFPLAVADDVPSFTEGTLRVRFKLIAGESDQSAGLVFNLKPTGEYLFVRYNTREGNAALWRFADGTRAAIAKGDMQLQLPLNAWHEIVVTIAGATITGTVNDQLRVQHTWTEPLTGKIGFWAKRDAVSAFKDLRVEEAPSAARLAALPLAGRGLAAIIEPGGQRQ